MTVNQIDQTAATTQDSTLLQKQEQKPKTNTVTPVKQDTVVLSETAKDLAALKAGTSAQEEANETITSKLKEQETKPKQ
jgi:hypothetical protein